MITIKEWMALVDYRITEGSDYFGNIPNLYCLDSWNGKQDGYSFCIIFDTKTQKVYEVQAHDYKNNCAYRLKDSEFNSDKNAWDDVDYIDLENNDDFMRKGLSIRGV